MAKANCFEYEYLEKLMDNYSTMMYLSAKVFTLWLSVTETSFICGAD